MPCDAFQPRTRYQTPSHQDGGQNLPTDLNRTVRLRHPGYGSMGNIMLVLPALDHPQGGIHHETARIACAIIANNSWDGFLTEDGKDKRVQEGPDDILRERDYYFHSSLDPTDEKYPLVPSFAHWRFPHDNLPISPSSYELPKPPPNEILHRPDTY